MKSTFYFILLFVFIFSAVSAQEKKIKTSEEQNTLAIFKMRDARENGDDITPEVIARKRYLCFYTLPISENLQLSNLSEIDDNQSFGPVYSITREVHPRTDFNTGSELITFYWSYNNNYDDVKGTGEVRLFVVHKPQGDYFEMTIIAENLDKLVYKGNMDGDLSVLEKFIENEKKNK